MKTPAPLIPDSAGYGDSRKNCDVLTVRLSKRTDSTRWQCVIRYKQRIIRISTRKHLRSRAEAFAICAEDHFRKAIRATGELPKSAVITTNTTNTTK